MRRAYRQSTRAQRRGVVYLAVLGVALLVMVIGMSALLNVRIENRAADLTATVAKADVYAQSWVDVSLNKLCNDANWRTTYTNNTWTAAQTVGDAILAFKLVDEIDGNLANDANQPARLYAKATVGDAVRIYSACVEPATPRNVLSNGDIEAGTQYWSGYNCTLAADAGDVHGGAFSLLATDRSSLSSGASQNIMSVVKNGTPYTFTAWAKVGSLIMSTKPRITIVSSGGGTQNFDGGVTVLGTSWTKITQTITPSWSGTLTSASLCTVSTVVTNSFRIDDVALLEPISGPALVITPGSWRREVLP